MGLSELVNHIYRMYTDDLIRCGIFTALIFCTIFHKYSGRRWLKPCVGAVLAVWFAVVLWLTVLGRSGGGVYETHWIPLHSYRAAFSRVDSEVLRSALMNVALFYPAGLLMAGLSPEKRSFRKGMLCTVLIFALLSLAIELSQYHWQLGNCEIDDVLHNALGAGLGFAAFRLDVDGAAGKNE